MWHRKVCVAVCTLNQWSLDFDGNLKRILESISIAYKRGARIRVGAELEIPGYMCQDHFHEFDTECHSWEVLEEIVKKSNDYRDMIIITGMPVRFNVQLYNCAIAIQNGNILLIRPKMKFCDDGVYRESRYFVRWSKPKETVEFRLPIMENSTVAFGDAIMKTSDGVQIGIEICEELFTCKSPHTDLVLQGVDIICNPSASFHVLGKSAHRINNLVVGSTAKIGGIYLYSNFRGCDGERVFYDGQSMIAQNGKLYAEIPQFDIEDVCVATATLDLTSNTTFRANITSIMTEASLAKKYFEVYVLGPITCINEHVKVSPEISPIILSKEEELLNGPPAFLWSYLRRSGLQGFFLPLSGGADSASVAVLVRAMCNKVFDAYTKAKRAGLNVTEMDEFKLAGGPIDVRSADDLCKKVFYTCYMQSKNSSNETKKFAQNLAKQISSSHLCIEIDEVVKAFVNITAQAFDSKFGDAIPWKEPRVSLSMQNVQARVRMVTSYLLAQLALYFGQRPGSLLVLGSSNVDEALVGYVTKYDCSAADFNPIGSINKSDLKRMLAFARNTMHLTALSEIIDAPPTAELLPREAGKPPQLDEVEIGLTYDEMNEIGMLRKPGSFGPYGTFLELQNRWHDRPLHEVASKVKRFYQRYGQNRHKATVLTPAYHASKYSCDDHRNDHRPFLYNTTWQWQFDKIDKYIEKHSGSCKQEKKYKDDKSDDDDDDDISEQSPFSPERC